jgi:hypothetical protein
MRPSAASSTRSAVSSSSRSFDSIKPSRTAAAVILSSKSSALKPKR